MCLYIEMFLFNMFKKCMDTGNYCIVFKRNKKISYLNMLFKYKAFKICCYENTKLKQDIKITYKNHMLK